jgi:hypothetical protein
MGVAREGKDEQGSKPRADDRDGQKRPCDDTAQDSPDAVQREHRRPVGLGLNAHPAKLLHCPCVAPPDDAQPEHKDQQDIENDQPTVPHRGGAVMVRQEADLHPEQERDRYEDHGDPDHDVEQRPDQRPVVAPD